MAHEMKSFKIKESIYGSFIHDDFGPGRVYAAHIHRDLPNAGTPCNITPSGMCECFSPINDGRINEYYAMGGIQAVKDAISRCA